MESKQIKTACKDHILKVIIETALLTEDEIRLATESVVEGGADFVKTSTGFSTRGAIVKDVEIMKAVVDDKKAKELEEKLRKSTFTFEDFLDQMQQMKNMGPLEDIIGMIPGMNSKALKGIKLPDNEFAKVEAIILSMTKKERQKPEIIDSSRRKRIAKGSGTSPADVNKLIKQFKDMRKMMKQFGNMSKTMGKRKFKLPFSF